MDSLSDPTRGERKRLDAPPGALEGRCVKVEASGMVWVLLDRQRTAGPRGPCPWAGYSSTAEGPQEGDTVWAVEADSGRLLVLAWWPL